ncbi:MAG: formylglycine-generating enzyme family protein [Odoribacter sp.]|nr:formylglycine-generating enzyme family protein [Odoribacter sp.]
MGEIEVSNEQYRAIFPEHDSRQVDQQWKDHVHGGYPANKDEQPAIRISWEEAMEYCRKLSEKTGLKINLPTEAQWEWAARAGSDSDFWYGAWNTDFAMYENMADKQMNKLAVRGVNPQPMSESDAWFPYYTYHPKLDYVDDGNMIMAQGASYEHNPWGIYDISGNVAEWTRSDYLPYPYKDNGNKPDKEKVVRGGSWKDHLKTASSYYCKSYLPWQKVHNVGFRVIIEE